MMPPQMGGGPPMGHQPRPPMGGGPPMGGPPMGGPPMGGGGPPPPQAPSDDEPPNKRPRGEDHLIPEDIFLARSPAPEVTFIVLVPQLGDRPEWRCAGQQCQITLPLSKSD